MLNKKEKENLEKIYRKQIESGELVQLEIKDKRDFRSKWFSKQDNKCPIINKEVPFERTSIDHKHRLRSDVLGGENSLGLVRGILYSPANVWEGKVVNSFKRMGLTKFIDIITALRNLADYLEEPPIPPLYIYPGEEPKIEKKKLGKRNYDKVIKYYFKMYPRARKLPKKPQHLTKAWGKYITDVNGYLSEQQKQKKQKKQQKHKKQKGR